MWDGPKCSIGMVDYSIRWWKSYGACLQKNIADQDQRTEPSDPGLLCISYKFAKGFLAITFLLLVFSNWNFHDMWQRFIYNQE